MKDEINSNKNNHKPLKFNRMKLILLVFSVMLLFLAVIMLLLWYDVRNQFKINPVNFYSYVRVSGKKVSGHVLRHMNDDLYLFCTDDHHYYKCHHSEMKPRFNWKRLIGRGVK